MVDRGLIERALRETLQRTDFPGLGHRYEGKVRDCYSLGDGRRTIITTDRVSAFDHVLGTIPFKGQVLTQLAAWWFGQTADVAPNHLIDVPDPNVLVCDDCEPILVEMVVRAYLTGTTSTSIWTHYERGERSFCGHELPTGMKKNQALAAPILTPATKAPRGEHDISGSREEILATGNVDATDFDEAAELAHALFERGQEVAAAHDLILVDTKYEFGRRRSDGKLVVIDEIHTPDSSRYWRKSSYEARFVAGEDPEPLDKDFVRRHYVGLGYRGDGPPPPLPDGVRIGAAERYIEAFERITGGQFSPVTGDPLFRIRTRLGV